MAGPRFCGGLFYLWMYLCRGGQDVRERRCHMDVFMPRQNCREQFWTAPKVPARRAEGWMPDATPWMGESGVITPISTG